MSNPSRQDYILHGVLLLSFVAKLHRYFDWLSSLSRFINSLRALRSGSTFDRRTGFTGVPYSRPSSPGSSPCPQQRMTPGLIGTASTWGASMATVLAKRTGTANIAASVSEYVQRSGFRPCTTTTVDGARILRGAFPARRVELALAIFSLRVGSFSRIVQAALSLWTLGL